MSLEPRTYPQNVEGWLLEAFPSERDSPREILPCSEKKEEGKEKKKKQIRQAYKFDHRALPVWKAFLGWKTSLWAMERDLSHTSLYRLD